MIQEATRFGISPEAWAKFDRRLKEEVLRQAHASADPLLVMISLAGWANQKRGMTVEQKQQWLSAAARDLLERLQQLGAQDVEGFWLNGTISARVPVKALREIGNREDVSQILLVENHRTVC